MKWKPLATDRQVRQVRPEQARSASTRTPVAYALAVVVAEKETPCEIRVAQPDAVQIFLNGKKLFEREEYHHGDPFDDHVGKGTLQAGRERGAC